MNGSSSNSLISDQTIGSSSSLSQRFHLIEIGIQYRIIQETLIERARRLAKEYEDELKLNSPGFFFTRFPASHPVVVPLVFDHFNVGRLGYCYLWNLCCGYRVPFRFLDMRRRGLLTFPHFFQKFLTLFMPLEWWQAEFSRCDFEAILSIDYRVEHEDGSWVVTPAPDIFAPEMSYTHPDEDALNCEYYFFYICEINGVGERNIPLSLQHNVDAATDSFNDVLPLAALGLHEAEGDEGNGEAEGNEQAEGADGNE